MNNELNLCLRHAERDLLATSTLRVRVLTETQIARTWPSVMPRLARLEQERLVFSFVAIAHPELPLAAPIIQWRRGDVLPDFGTAAYQLRARWTMPAVATKCVIAGKLAGRMFGGHGGRYPRESEESHDIHHAAVFLRFREREPELVSSWVHEEELRRDRKDKRGKVPASGDT